MTLLDKLYDRYKDYTKSSTNSQISSGESSDVNLREMKHLLIDETSRIFRQMATGVRKQGNLSVSDKFLRQSLKARTSNNSKFDFKFFYSLVKLHCLKASRAPTVQESVSQYAKALKFLLDKKSEEKIAIESSLDYHQLFLLVEAGMYERLYMYVVENRSSTTSASSASSSSAAAPIDIFKITKTAFSENELPYLEKCESARKISQVLLTSTLNCYGSVTKLFDESGNENSERKKKEVGVDGNEMDDADDVYSSDSVKRCAKAYLRYGLFCDQICT